MIRKIVTALVLIPLAAAIVALAVANRQTVVLSFDPFDQATPALALAVPLYALVIGLVIAGVVVGGIAAWLGQRRWRARARAAEWQARELRAENDRLKRRDGLSPPSAQANAPVEASRAPRLSIPPPVR